MSDPTVTHGPGWAARTDVGQRREHNEDSLIAAPPVFAVADGVGGAIAGERASSLALETLAGCIHPVVDAAEDAAACQAIAAAIESANDAVRAAQQADAELDGMATTLTAAVQRGPGRLVIGHVGDSRAYRVGPAPRELQQLSEDHSVVAELVKAGRIEPDEVATHPHRHAITRALGADDHVAVDAFTADLPAGSWLVLCSDGLTGHVADEEIALEVQQLGRSPQDAVEALVDLANERGGHDNITVVVVGSTAERGAGEAESPAAMSSDLAVAPIDRSDTSDIPMVTPEMIAAAAAEGESDMADDIEPSPLDPTAQRPAADERATAADDGDVPSSWIRTMVIVVAVLSVLIAVTGFAWTQSYVLVVRSDGHVGIDRGFPAVGPTSTWRTSDVQADELPEAEQRRLLDEPTMRSREDVLRIYRRLPELAGRCDGVLDTSGAADPQTQGLTDPACSESEQDSAGG